MNRATVTLERIDELPTVIYCLKQMHVDVNIDRKLEVPHGNWEGLSYREVALAFIAYTVMRSTRGM